MKRYLEIIIAIALLAIFVAGWAVTTHWSEIDADNNAFAKDCNDRGGIANFGGSARQCYGATIVRKG